MHDAPAIPRGEKAWELFDSLEHRAAEATTQHLPASGEKGAAAWEHLGSVLLELDSMASCLWGCAGGDHAVEYLVGRAVGAMRAAVRLSRAAFYDKALNALRTASEVINLLWLFGLEPERLAEWRVADARRRFELARPTRVIRALSALGQPLPLDFDRYDRLSRLSHANATAPPQAHNPLGVPLVGNHFQQAGWLVVLNECSTVAALAVPATLQLIDVPKAVRVRSLETAHQLAENIGAADLRSIERFYESQQSSPDVLAARAAYRRRFPAHSPEVDRDDA